MSRNLPILLRCIWPLLGLLVTEVANAKAPSSFSATPSVVITTDLVVHENGQEAAPLVDVPRDIVLANSLNVYLRKALEKRGITVIATETASVGLRYGYTTQEPAQVRFPAEPGSTPAPLTTQSAPYWVSEPYKELPSRAQLQNALEDLNRYEMWGKRPTKSLSTQQLGAPAGATHRLLVLAEATQVPLKNILKRELLPHLRMRSSRDFPTLKLRIGLVEIASGNFVVVEDCSGGGKFTIDDRAVRDRSRKFLAKLDRLLGREPEE